MYMSISTLLLAENWGSGFDWILMSNTFFSSGLPPPPPPPQQQQMLSLRAANQPSLLNANPMLQRALLMQQMQGTVVMGDAYCSYLIALHGLKPKYGCFFLNRCSPCIWHFGLSSFSPSNLFVLHIMKVLHMMKIPRALMLAIEDSTRSYQNNTKYVHWKRIFS